MQNIVIQNLQPVKHEHTLNEVLSLAESLGINMLDFPDNMTKKRFRTQVEKKIVEHIHPYKFFRNKNDSRQWFTHLPDHEKSSGRRLLKRIGYDRICHAVVDYYLDNTAPSITIDSLFTQWAIYRRDDSAVKPSTVRKDVSLYRTHCRDVKIKNKALANWRVADITAKDLCSFFRQITKYRKYTRRFVNNIKAVLNGMFYYAVEQELISSNPVRDVDTKRLTYKPEQDKRDNVYTKEEAQKLLAYLETLSDDPYALAIRLDFNMFIRVGEIAGLKWENVDTQNRSIYICHQITYEPEMNDNLKFNDKKMVIEDYLKGYTSQGYRYEFITDDALDVLKRAREINPNGEYVFMPFGRPIITTTFNKRLKKYCAAAGVPYRSSHKIRFYACSMAYDGENLQELSKMMGHSQVSTTLRYLRDVKQDDDYSDLFKNLGRQKTSK